MENQEEISKMGAEVTMYRSPVSEITIYSSPMLESKKGMEVRNWKVLESTQRFPKVLEGFWEGHVS